MLSGGSIDACNNQFLKRRKTQFSNYEEVCLKDAIYQLEINSLLRYGKLGAAVIFTDRTAKNITAIEVLKNLIQTY